MEYKSSEYYRSIKTLSFNKKELIKVINPTIVPSIKVFGITIRKKHIRYKVEDFGECVIGTLTKWKLRSQYLAEKDGDLILINSKPNVVIDGLTFYFKEDKEAKDFFSLVKGRCTECGNKLYKSADDKLLT